MAKTAAWVFGVVFVLVGVLGFIPNGLVGPGAFFDATALHSIVHIILGLILIWAAAKMPMKAGKANLWVGVIYLVIAVLGFVWDSFLGIIPLNSADNWLHVVLGVVLVAVGWMAKGSSMSAPATGAPQM